MIIPEIIKILVAIHKQYKICEGKCECPDAQVLDINVCPSIRVEDYLPFLSSIHYFHLKLFQCLFTTSRIRKNE